MTIWVDADATPRVIKELLFRAAERRSADVVLVANSWQQVPARVRAVRVEGGPDRADDHIVEHCVAGDLVVSDDVPLAARAVERGAEVLTTRGDVLDPDNVGERLSVRDFHDDLRSSGVQTSGPAPFRAGDRQRFADALDRWLTRHGRR